jgi:formiminotetrahydrofolate cyclodeaminase
MKDLESFQLGEFLEAVAAKSPAPGGGAVASVVGALGASLAQMVVAYSLGRKGLAGHQPALEQASGSLARVRALLLGLAAEDAAGYALLNELQRLPETDARRAAELPAAAAAAIQAPRDTAAACADLLRLIERLAPITNPHLRSDLAIAAMLAEAGVRAGWWNVLVNLPLVEDPAQREATRKSVQELVDVSAARRADVERACSAEPA